MGYAYWRRMNNHVGSGTLLATQAYETFGLWHIAAHCVPRPCIAPRRSPCDSKMLRVEVGGYLLSGRKMGRR
jgi:hypothetical protein